MNKISLPFLLITLLFARGGLAQCGSQGDPIVNITFGTTTNPDFGGGTTTYTPRPNGQLDNGDYKLGSNVRQGRPEWHNLTDHTGGGMMLLVNADYNAGEFYRIPVSGLCENTRFSFSAWIANANQPDNCGELVIPNVRFVIEDVNGNVVNDPYATGDILATEIPEWQPYGFEFDTGNQTEFYLVLVNDNPGGCGNDLAIDDIQFRPCGPQLELTMDETLKQADTLFFCEGATAPIPLSGGIVADDSYATDPVFHWQISEDGQSGWTDMPGEDNQELSVAPIPNRWYRLTAAASLDNLYTRPLCRISSNPIRIAQIAPQTDATGIEERGPICDTGSMLLAPPEYTGADVGPVTYQWMFDDGDGAVELPGATSPAYEFHAAALGTFRLLRQAINVCGDRVVTHTFDVPVEETIRTTFVLPQEPVCADHGPVLLSGGTLVNGADGMQGVYSGPGVSGGYFYPRLAGPGQHTITFSPPPHIRCAEPSQAIITVHDSIYLEPMLDIVMLPGQHAILRPQTNASQFSWSSQPGLDNYQTRYPMASPDQTTTYTLTASNEMGCDKTEDVTVTVLPDLRIPNSFTPNGDGLNDTWEIDGLGQYPHVRIQVFNRWGTLVFASNGYATPWDGQFKGAPLPTATYYYTLHSDVLPHPLSGSVSILR